MTSRVGPRRRAAARIAIVLVPGVVPGVNALGFVAAPPAPVAVAWLLVVWLAEQALLPAALIPWSHLVLVTLIFVRRLVELVWVTVVRVAVVLVKLVLEKTLDRPGQARCGGYVAVAPSG